MAKETVIRTEPFVELVKENKRWHWILWAQNGRPVAMSAVDYSRSNDAASGFITAGKLLTKERVKFLVSKKVVHDASEHKHPERRKVEG